MENTRPPRPVTPAPPPAAPAQPPASGGPATSAPLTPSFLAPLASLPALHKRVLLSVAILAAGAILVLVILLLSARPAAPPAPLVRPTPTVTPTPTPVRILSAVASQSAFLEFGTSLGGISASLGSYNPQDQVVKPPIIDLPLGFPQ